MSKTRSKSTLLPWGVATCLIAGFGANCAGGEGEALDDTEVGEQGAELGEASCAAATPDATLLGFNSHRAVPPYSNPNCVGAVVVDAPDVGAYVLESPVLSYGLLAYSVFPAGPKGCPASARIDGTLYERNGPEENSWRTLREWRKVAPYAHQGNCYLSFNASPYLTPGYDYRIAVRSLVGTGQREVTVAVPSPTAPFPIPDPGPIGGPAPVPAP